MALAGVRSSNLEVWLAMAPLTYCRSLEELEVTMAKRMGKTYKERLHGEHNTDNLVKSFICESHSHTNGTTVDWLEDRVNTHAAQFKGYDVWFERPDPTKQFVVMFFRKRDKSDAKISHVYIDHAGTDPRFWRLHTLSKGQVTEKILQKLVLCAPGLDFVWLSNGFLQTISKWGKTEKLGFASYRPMASNNTNLEDDERARRLDLVGEPEFVEYLYGYLTSNNNRFHHGMALRSVRIKRFDELEPERRDGSPPRCSIDDVYYNGKFTARGKLYDQHRELMTKVEQTYARMVRKVEELTRPSIGGAVGYVYFQLPKPVKNLEAFVDHMFSTRKPYNLMGFKERTGDQAFHVVATDLHSGAKVDFDIYPTLIRTYLYPGSCGNSVLRTLTNLHQSFSAEVKILDREGNEIVFDD